jgi:putative ABC transport system ATP-binding protein
MPSETAVRCASLVKIYPSATRETHALRGVEASFAAGTLTAVTGPVGQRQVEPAADPGAARTAQRRPALGARRRRVHPRRPELQALRRSHVAWVAQRPTHSLFGHLTARGNLEQVARLRGTATDRRRRPARALGIAHRSSARTDALSGGEQQRLAVAAALLGTPAVVLADEPTAELDDDSATLVLAELTRCATAGSAVVFATHDARAVRSADRVLHMRHGVLSTERAAGRAATAPIDASGRLQLPPEALALFPDDRAVIEITDGRVHLIPPGDGDGDPS